MKIALFGVGHWHGPMHVQAALAAGAGIAAIWDPDPATAARIAAGAGAPVAATPQAALDLRPDLCVLMGHPHDVPALARMVIAARLPLMLEKPAAPATAPLRALETLARQHGAFVAVPLANRLSPALQGSAPVAHATFRIVNGPPRRYADWGVPWVLDPAVSGGGALRNLGLHGIDSARSLATGPLRVLSAHLGHHTRTTVEDHALVTLTDTTGALFTVEAGYTAPGPASSDYAWRVAHQSETLIDRGASAIRMGADGDSPLPPLPLAARYDAFMADTLARLRDSRPPLADLSDYVAAMDLIDTAYAMAAQ